MLTAKAESGRADRGTIGAELRPSARSAFLQACRRQSTPYTPIWLMRQAGRFMKEYRNIRAKVGFLELCKNADLAAEVTLLPVDKLAVDAAIIFADILLPLEPMGIRLEYSQGDGPIIHNPIRTPSAVDHLHVVTPEESLCFVLDAIRKVKSQLNPAVPLIGFAGAPFTLSSYLIEGGASRHFERTKTFMYREPDAWHKLMRHLADTTSQYLNSQIARGAEVVQLFDSWIGCLSPADYRRFVLPHTRRTISQINVGTPVIHFGTGTAALLELLSEAGGDVIGLDWRVNLADAWSQLGPNMAIQGNLDPVILMADRAYLRTEVEKILDLAAGRPGHIFNLGHGVLPETPEENVRYLVELVHELGSR